MGLGAVVSGMGQSQQHFAVTALGGSRHIPSGHAGHQDPALPFFYRHGMFVGHCISGRQKRYYCNDLGYFIVTPAVSLKAFSFISRVRGWRSFMDRKPLLVMMPAATLRSKTQQGLVNLIWKFSFWSSTHAKAGEDEQSFWPSCRKVCLMKNGLASCFTLTEGWQGELRAFLPQNLLPKFDLCTQCPSPGISRGTLPPTKLWSNLGFWRLKTFVRKQNSKGMVGAAPTLTLGNDGLSQQGIFPPAQEGRWEKGLMQPPSTSMERLLCSATLQAPNTKDQRVTAFGICGVLQLWNKSSFLQI